ncbi:methylated-DNA--[protein]-cysteine S-methyltransferase [Streptomyces malaysiensis subsp. malaysiensis]|uniref:methylated-DNA--[protein]-cysteine S-methyltransferase n=1 Tax=Streptomyces malaysiensis TaxID=92644 RepID=UPI000BFD7B91|nr:methylated-DNA--[protein]-cysteine S-methyltransferase [Streptomyces malaysiensis]ATL82141.1 methylated-DNA--protein-cysteine S-methyltransferase [Streptomyces malaysiensis]QDL73504.1 methylated-DNA--[protein]-cysteine S-methyltransferase [Streptomyces malaysiensis]
MSAERQTQRDPRQRPEQPERRDARAWAWAVRATPIGPLLLAATDEGLAQVVFHAEEKTAAEAVARLTRRLGAEPMAVSSAVPGSLPSADSANSTDSADSASAPRCAEHLAEAVRQVESYFAGDTKAFTLSLDWSLTAGFNRRVLRELAAHVPFGTVVGYQDLADRVGEPGAARAVGVAMGSNPLPVVVACHRVVESGGGIGGFGGGLETKRTLLALEGVLPQPLF